MLRPRRENRDDVLSCTPTNIDGRSVSELIRDASNTTKADRVLSDATALAKLKIPPGTPSLRQGTGTVGDLPAVAYLKKSGALAPNANAVEAHVGPVVSPFVGGTVGGVVGLIARGSMFAMGGYEAGQGARQIHEGEYLDGSLTLASGGLNLLGTFGPTLSSGRSLFGAGMRVEGGAVGNAVVPANSVNARWGLRESLAREAGVPRGLDNVWNSSLADLQASYVMDGATVTPKPARASSSGNAQVLTVSDHPLVKEVQYSPSTAHLPVAKQSQHVGQYYKFTYNDNSLAKVIDPQTYRVLGPEKNTKFYNPTGSQITYDSKTRTWK